MLHIKTVAEAELPLIHELGKACFYPTYLPFISKEQVDYMFHMMYALPALVSQQQDKGHVFLMASDEDRPLGFVSYQPDSDGKGNCKVHKLYVLPGSQTGGLGRTLLDKVAEQALVLGQQSIILNVNRYNKAVGFYRHLGFVIVAEDDIDIGNGYFMNDYEMKKSLEVSSDNSIIC